jgi:hypothetical protein
VHPGISPCSLKWKIINITLFRKNEIFLLANKKQHGMMIFNLNTQHLFSFRVFVQFLIFSAVCSVMAQETESNGQRNAVGLGFGFIPKHDEETFIPAVDICYTYALNDRWGVGVKSGIHFTQKNYYIVAAKADYRIYKGLGAGVAAGVAMKSKEISPLIGVEFCYEFYWKGISFGPMVEISYHNDHEHFQPGVHFSVPF